MTFQSPGHLAWQVRIVDEQGRPTPAFLRFIQQMTGNGASTDTTAKQALDGLADKQPADNDLTALSELAGAGIAVRSATDTWALRTLQAGTGISITNPAGIAGDPSIACTISQYTDEQAQDAVATMLVAGTNITLTYNDALNTLTIDAAGGGGSGTVTTTGSPSSGALAKFSGGSSIANADLTGDVTTSGGLATTIAAKAVTLAKMADVATSTVFYRKSAGSGAPEVQTLATLKTDLGLTGTNSGDQTITLTGDVTGSGTGSFAATLAASGVTAGTYGDATHVAQVTVDAKGRVTSASSVAVSGGSTTFRGCLVTKSADQTGANYTTIANIAWDAENYDTDSIHDNVTNNSRLTVPSGVTKVRLRGHVRLNNNTADTWTYVTIRKNGASNYVGNAELSTEIGAVDANLVLATAVLTVTAGDFFELALQVESDTSIDVTATRSWFAMEIIQ